MAKIGFVGLGHMGNPMARNLLKSGHQVKVYDVVPQAVKALQEEGALAAANLKDLASDADLVFTMLQTGEQVLKTCLDADGVFAHLAPDKLYIDSSSIEIKATQELHQEALKRKIRMLDAPVSGGVPGASTASLTIMVGGSADDFEQAKPYLNQLGKKIIHVGPAGHGQAAKICNNLILGVSMIGVCESLNLADKLGLDLNKFFEISSNASGQCWSLNNNCPAPGILEGVPANYDYKAGFMAKMMLKDLRLAQQAAKQSEASLTLGADAIALYSRFVEQGFGELDFSGIIKMIKEM